MSFPYQFEANFEVGTLAPFDSETDTESRLDFPHFSDLSRVPIRLAPYRGAYCMRVNLANDGSPADAYVQEDVAFDMAADETKHIRFYFALTHDAVMANNDEFIIFALQSAGPVNEVVVVINFTTANGFRVGVGETGGTQFKPLTLGEWHCLELNVNLDNAGSNDGTIDAFLDNSAFTQITALDQAVTTQARMGVLSQDAGTTAGTVLFDQVVADDTRVGPIAIRWPQEILLTRSGHAFVGRGECSVTLLSGAGTDCSLAVYDTDVGSTTAAGNFAAELKNTVQMEVVPRELDVRVQRGCYIVLGGTDPRALVKIHQAPNHFSDGNVRAYGLHRTAHPLGL